jgi:hypothetical protein
MRTGRRQFIKAAALSAVSARRVLGANEKIRVGVVGTGGRGQLLLDVPGSIMDDSRVGHDMSASCLRS